MSLFVARMITPLIAAYFLRSQGVQPHAGWKWMDLYLKVLNWSLDTTKADAMLARLPKPSRAASAIMRSAPCSLLLVVAAFVAGTGAAMPALGKPGMARRDRRSCSRLLVGAARRLWRRQALGFLVRLIGSRDFADWHGIVAARWNARMHDHRMAMVGAGIVTLLLSVVCSARCPIPSSRRRTTTIRASTSPCRQAAR